MIEAITIAELAKEMNTNPLRINRVMGEKGLKFTHVKRTYKHNKGLCNRMVKAVPGELVEKVKMLLVNKPTKRSKEKSEPEPVKFLDKRPITELFERPIISQDFKTGIITGTGMESVWSNESAEIIV